MNAGHCWGDKEAPGRGGSATRLSVFVVRFFLRGVCNSVLTLGGSRPQAVQPPAVLRIIDVIFKKQLHRKECCVWITCVTRGAFIQEVHLTKGCIYLMSTFNTRDLSETNRSARLERVPFNPCKTISITTKHNPFLQAALSGGYWCCYPAVCTGFTEYFFRLLNCQSLFNQDRNHRDAPTFL